MPGVLCDYNDHPPLKDVVFAGERNIFHEKYKNNN